MLKKIPVLFCIFLIFSYSLFSQSKNYFIVFIGNSITHGAGLKNPATDAPPVHAIAWLQALNKYGELNFSNQGVGGATTIDFLPATNKFFPRVIQGADLYKNQKDATLVFSMILGTNDSAVFGPNGAPVSPESYEKNVKTIIDTLLNKYPGSIVILHRPVWYSPNTYNRSRYMEEGLNRLQTYFPVLEKVIASYKSNHPTRVFSGDKDAFEYFKKNAISLYQKEKGNAGMFLLHPNEKGAQKLGVFWAKGIEKCLQTF
jgi:lysophospholipase L1-like esterase